MDLRVRAASKSLLTALVVSSSLLIAWKLYQRRKEAKAYDKERDDGTAHSSNPAGSSSRRQSAYVSSRLEAHRRLKHLNLSPTVSIDMIKLQRWERLIPKLTMKRPMYDNIRMHDPDGTLLCTIGQKKAHWYVRKNLAEWQDNEHSSIRLLFRPNTDGKEKEEAFKSFNQSTKQNQCVVCGAHDNGYMRFYIVPYCYRTHFPTLYKSHMPHDVVLLCPACQIPAQRACHRRQMALERPFVLDGPDSKKYLVDSRIHQLRKRAGALSRPGLPPDRREQYLGELRQFLGTDAVSQEDIDNILQREEKVLNPEYVSPCEKLVKSLMSAAGDDDMDSVDDLETRSVVPGTMDALEQFVRDWRCHFVSTMEPRYLPRGWSVDSPVRCQSSRSWADSAVN